MRPGGKIILLDLGGVLVEATGRKALAALLPHLDDEQILARWHQSRAVDRFERGKLSEQAFASAFVAEWGLEMSEAQFVEHFASWVNGFFEGAADLIQALRPRYQVGCLSNTNAIHWARLPGVSSLFDWSFPSHVTGFMKPERQAYDHALGELRVPPQEVYFFDDLMSNVAAAREAGINAFRVAGFENLLEVLKAQGLHHAQTPGIPANAGMPSRPGGMPRRGRQ
jgi:putative hydrolase of the HAD superfamily